MNAKERNAVLKQVQDVYSGAEGDLWELLMGEQIHIGGFQSSQDLAEKAGISGGMSGVDLCCCNGAGMRFLLRFRRVDGMCGVDATPTVVERGRQRCEKAGFGDRVRFILSDVCESGLPTNASDFVWGEDAWCYVENKEKLIAEAARMVKKEGVVAFTDWIAGTTAMTEEEKRRFLAFMKFPNVETMNGYKRLLEANGLQVERAEDTGRFARSVQLYIDMAMGQLTYDVMRILNFNTEVLQGLAGEMAFMHTLAVEGKIAQGLFVARKTS